MSDPRSRTTSGRSAGRLVDSVDGPSPEGGSEMLTTVLSSKSSVVGSVGITLRLLANAPAELSVKTRAKLTRNRIAEEKLVSAYDPPHRWCRRIAHETESKASRGLAHGRPHVPGCGLDNPPCSASYLMGTSLTLTRTTRRCARLRSNQQCARSGTNDASRAAYPRRGPQHGAVLYLHSAAGRFALAANTPYRPWSWRMRIRPSSAIGRSIGRRPKYSRPKRLQWDGGRARLPTLTSPHESCPHFPGLGPVRCRALRAAGRWA
jgi:hypothetical protein